MEDFNTWCSKNVTSKKIEVVKNSTKSVEQIIKEKKLAFKDQGDGTLLSSMELDGVILAAVQKDGELDRESYRPTPEQLAMINKSGVPKTTQKENSGYVFTLQATNAGNRPDRRSEAFTDSAHAKMGYYAVKNHIPYLVASKSDCEDHTWKAMNAYGFVFNAYVKDGALMYETYIAEKDFTKDILDRLFDGPMNKLSVGFSMNYADVMCSVCMDKSIVDEECPHQPGMMDKKSGQKVVAIITDVVDNYEISAVAVPCQAEANVTQDSVKKSLPETVTGNKSLSTNPHVIEKTLENSEIGKINNGKNTIEDNSVMSVENTKETAKEEAVETAKVVAAETAEVVTNAVEKQPKEEKTETRKSDLDETKLCGIADKAKSAAVKELSEVINTDMTKVLEAVKELGEKVEKLEKKLKKSTKKVAEQIQKASGVCVPEIKQVDSTKSTAEKPLDVSTDNLIPKNENNTSENPMSFLV